MRGCYFYQEIFVLFFSMLFSVHSKDAHGCSHEQNSVQEQRRIAVIFWNGMRLMGIGNQNGSLPGYFVGGGIAFYGIFLISILDGNAFMELGKLGQYGGPLMLLAENHLVGIDSVTVCRTGDANGYRFGAEARHGYCHPATF